MSKVSAGYTRVFRSSKIAGHVIGVLRAAGEHFDTAPVDELVLGFNGIAGDLHEGATRAAGGREPWYQRGTEIKNLRQVSIVSPADLRAIAAALDVDQVQPDWLGSNMVIDGIPRLSMLPAGTVLLFAGGAALHVTGQNAPCKFAGAEIAKHFPDRSGLDLEFPRVATRLRGLVASVEKPGTVCAGEEITLRLPEQWIYQFDEMRESEQDLFSSAQNNDD